jgi:NAD(P)-dependent dehydrogenase (short-subunit alcohol dehydrogenase family)
MITKSEDGSARVAFVTGAGGGIGRAAALTFAARGLAVAVVDRQVESGEQTAEMIRAAGGQAFFLAADVTRGEEVRGAVAATVERFGRLDCAFNNAGIEGMLGALHTIDDDDFERVFSVNTRGVWLCMKAQLQQMLAQGGGAIVNTASVAGLVGAGMMPAYSASKHAVVGLTRSAAIAYSRHGIRINAVCPGVIETDMATRAGLTSKPQVQEALLRAHPIGRFGRPEEVAKAVVWLCSEEASFVTGHAMAVDGGFVAG